MSQAQAPADEIKAKSELSETHLPSAAEDSESSTPSTDESDNPDEAEPKDPAAETSDVKLPFSEKPIEKPALKDPPPRKPPIEAGDDSSADKKPDEPIEPKTNRVNLDPLLPDWDPTKEDDSSESEANDKGDEAVTEPRLSEHALPDAELDLLSKLAVKIDQIEMPPMALARFIAMISTMTNVKIEVDAAALHRVGGRLEDEVSVKVMQPTELSKVLETALAQRGLTYRATGEQLMVTLPSAEKSPLRQIRYSVSDLAADKQALASLGSMTRQVVAPGSWQLPGGRGEMKIDHHAMLVKQTKSAHWKILFLCEKFRVARGLKPKSKFAAERFRLTSRQAGARETLEKAVSLKMPPGTPLSDVAQALSIRGKVQITLDPIALARVDYSTDMPVQLNAADLPLGELLAGLLKPHGLTFQILGPRAFHITTPMALERARIVEFYSVPVLADDAAAGRRLIERIRSEIAAASWKSDRAGVALHFDVASNCLIVRQSPPVQNEIEAALARWRAE